MIPSGYQQLSYESMPMYAPGTPVAVTPVYPNYELIANRVFVGGFPSATTEVELRQHFEQFCQIREAKVIRSTEGTSKGYGFLTFETDEEAENIKNMTPEKLEFKGRRLNIGPALRRVSGSRFTEYAIATPTGVVPSPTVGYSYVFPQSPYMMVGQPSPFMQNTPTQAQPFIFPQVTAVPQQCSTDVSTNVTSSADCQSSTVETTPGKKCGTAQLQHAAPVAVSQSQPQQMCAPAQYYLPVPGTPVTPTIMNGVRSPSAVYSPSPFFIPQEQVHYQHVPNTYYHPQQQNMAPAQYAIAAQSGDMTYAEESNAAYWAQVNAQRAAEHQKHCLEFRRNEISRLSLRRKAATSVDSCGESHKSSSSESPPTLLERKVKKMGMVVSQCSGGGNYYGNRHCASPSLRFMGEMQRGTPSPRKGVSLSSRFKNAHQGSECYDRSGENSMN